MNCSIISHYRAKRLTLSAIVQCSALGTLPFVLVKGKLLSCQQC